MNMAKSGIVVATIVCVAIAFAQTAFGLEWRNITPETRIGGRIVSPGYLQGKVVLLDCRDYADSSNAEALKRLQNVWRAYASKQFVVLGCHTGRSNRAAAASLMSRLGITYPVYEGAFISGDEDESPPSRLVAVVDATASTFVYSGSDDRKAAGACGDAIFSAKRPSGPNQWKRIIDYEIEHLPGSAYIRMKDLGTDKADLKELAQKYPEDMKRYVRVFAEYKKRNEVKRLAELVAAARLLKDRDPSAKNARKITKSDIDRLEAKYVSLKSSEDPKVAQEAKNSLYDIKYVKAALAR